MPGVRRHLGAARACAILTGIGTVREDDPQLTVRAVETPRQPQLEGAGFPAKRSLIQPTRTTSTAPRAAALAMAAVKGLAGGP